MKDAEGLFEVAFKSALSKLFPGVQVNACSQVQRCQAVTCQADVTMVQDNTEREKRIIER